jgi:hypothetical protein
MIRIACAAAAAVLFAVPVSAQTATPGPACVKRAELIKHLQAQYQ